MDPKAVTQSVDEATRALKSSFTEGSSKLFGSVRDAKRGLFGGISSTFDHVVNIVGGPDDGSKAAASTTSASGGETTGRPPLDSKPPFRRRNTNPFMEGYDPNVVENEIPPPAVTSTTTADGATVVPAYQSVEPSRAWDNMAGSAAPSDPHSGIPRIPSGEPSAFLARSQRDPNAGGQGISLPSAGGGRAAKNRGGDDSDADSEATEGCDEHGNDEELGEDGLQTGNTRSESASRNSEQSWTNDIDDMSQLDTATKDCIDFMKYFVDKVIDPSAQITAADKAKFGELCQQGIGRLWFAKFVNAQRAHNKALPESVILNLVQFIAIVLFECNEAEDYGPAKTLMNMAFTFYHEAVQETKTGPENIFNKLKSLVGVSKRKTFLYSYLKDQAIWQSPRFWNAAFFFAVQHERASKPTATCNVQSQGQTDEARQQENITFGLLRTFTSNMRALGVPKDHCLEFIRRQASLANLPNAQIKILRENMEQWTEEAANK